MRPTGGELRIALRAFRGSWLVAGLPRAGRWGQARVLREEVAGAPPAIRCLTGALGLPRRDQLVGSRADEVAASHAFEGGT